MSGATAKAAALTILVTGGAGYIGSHVAQRLVDDGHVVVVVDNLSNGPGSRVAGTRFHQGDIGDRSFIEGLFASQGFDAVMHFAGSIQVGESVTHPALYYRNNVAASLVLFDAMLAHGVMRLVFSSTAAIFGAPDYVPIDEAHPVRPVNPYGRSKRIVEDVLEDYRRAHGLESTCLRYFNAAGADPQGRLGECHEPETHLIPLVLQVASGRRPTLSLFGDEHDTPDGTCIRDYVHVADLAEAHLLALSRLVAGARGGQYNLGNGTGFSVREIVAAAARVTGRPIPVQVMPAREGDPARLVADAHLAFDQLGWRPRHPAIETILEDAWNWERRHFAHAH